MDEDKIQRLHDSLSKLRKGKGLGTNSHYSWNAHESIPLKEDKDGKMYREDGLPVNGLYANFIKAGSYDPDSVKENSALKYGDGRKIKRNFDDIDAIGDGDDNGKKKKKQKKSKEERKAEKKAAKIEAKKQAKLEEKRRLKLEAKQTAKKLEAKESSEAVHVSKTTKKEASKISGVSNADADADADSNDKKRKKKKSKKIETADVKADNVIQSSKEKEKKKKKKREKDSDEKKKKKKKST